MIITADQLKSILGPLLDYQLRKVITTNVIILDLTYKTHGSTSKNKTTRVTIVSRSHCAIHTSKLEDVMSI